MIPFPQTYLLTALFAYELGVPHLGFKGGKGIPLCRGSCGFSHVLCTFPFAKVKLLSLLQFHGTFLQPLFQRLACVTPFSTGLDSAAPFCKGFAYVVLPFLKGLGKILWLSLQSLLELRASEAALDILGLPSLTA